jgi:hypothetical protein
MSIGVKPCPIYKFSPSRSEMVPKADAGKTRAVARYMVYGIVIVKAKVLSTKEGAYCTREVIT